MRNHICGGGRVQGCSKIYPCKFFSKKVLNYLHIPKIILIFVQTKRENMKTKRKNALLEDGELRVVFRKFKSGEWKGDIIALFPDMVVDYNLVGCYQHVGQHGSANYNHIISQTVLATPDEYADLLKELKESAGYTDLIIVKRAQVDYSLWWDYLKEIEG